MGLRFRLFFEEQDKKDGIANHLDKHGHILFFQKGDDLFGAPEESRLVFAKLKQPDEDMTGNWKDELSFIASNLVQSLLGRETENMFGSKDLGDIKVLDKDAIVDLLLNKGKCGTVIPKER